MDPNRQCLSATATPSLSSSCCFGPTKATPAGEDCMIWKKPDNARHAVKSGAIDSLIAKELNELTLKDRERLLDDIHGVAENVGENPEFVSECLAKMDEEILKIRKRSAYDRALFLHPKLVKGRKFRLLFLRADCFDPAKAARRIVKHFEFKLALFGPEKLIEKITYNDLTNDDRDALFSGSAMFLKKKDIIGRTVMHFSNNLVAFKNWQNQIRTAWYQIMQAVENDEDIQKKGVVLIVQGRPAACLSELLLKGPSFGDGLPMRFAGVHLCYACTSLRPFMNFVLKFCGRDFRIRCRAHFGSPMEIMYALKSYGIPEDILPLNLSNGDVDLTEFIASIEQTRLEADNATILQLQGKQQNFVFSPQSINGDSPINVVITSNGSETPNTSLKAVDYPSLNDVLLGRGRPFQEFPGNLRFRQIIDAYWSEYQAADQYKKNSINRDIVKMIKVNHGRFLRQALDQDEWVEVDDTVARLKVSHGFRNKTRRSDRPFMGQVAAKEHMSLDNTSN